MDIYYINSLGQIAYLDRSPYRLLSATTLFDYEWSYTTNDLNGISNILKEVAEKDIDLVISGINKQEYYENLSNFMEIADADLKNGTPGRLYVGDYFIKCYFKQNKKGKKCLNVKQSVQSITLVAFTDWIKETLTRFRYEDVSASADDNGKGYPHAYPYDYSVSNGLSGNLNNEHFADSNFIMIIYGYAEYPSVTIGGNVYRLNYIIPAGSRVVINSANQTITLIHANDQRENLFRYRDRNYNIFQKIPSGELNVMWNTKFDFDVWLCTERSEPEWK